MKVNRGDIESLFGQLTPENKEKVNQLIATLRASQSDRPPTPDSLR